MLKSSNVLMCVLCAFVMLRQALFVHGKPYFFVRWTTARQVINMVAGGFEPALFICEGSALTTRIMPVPHILVLKDHVQTEG